MSSVSVSNTPSTKGSALDQRSSAWLFGVATLAVIFVSFGLSTFAPIGFSIVAVFLFAGPHNWMEARYFMERMPPKWGRLRVFYTTALSGVIALAAAFILLPILGRRLAWSYEAQLLGISLWNATLIGWILTLVHLRSRQTPERNWQWVWPVGFVLMAAAFLWPLEWGIALVYLHPMVALFFLDRELKKHNHHWRPMYHFCLAVVACLAVTLWVRLAQAPPLPGEDNFTTRITHFLGTYDAQADPEKLQKDLNTRIIRHSGANIFPQVSSRMLVGMHTFLEMLHYMVWLVVIPLVSFRAPPWKLNSIPLSKRSSTWRLTVLGVIAIGSFLVLGFWVGFAMNYPITRDIYFSVALAHVLAEVPFLLRSL